MTSYTGADNTSFIQSFELGENWIDIHFADGSTERYSSDAIAEHHLTEMKRLAHDGAGLNTYINKHVKFDAESRR